MKNYLIVITAVLFLFACKNAETPVGKAVPDRTEVTSCIESRFVLRDTAVIKNIASEDKELPVYKYNEFNESHLMYLTQTEFIVLRKSIQELIRNPQSYIYQNLEAEPLNREKVQDKITECDSITESNFDAKGNEVQTSFWACDSVSILNNINMIVFYESWFINNETKMLEKEMLGYSVCSYEPAKKGFRMLFYVLKDKEDALKIKKKMTWYFS